VNRGAGSYNSEAEPKSSHAKANLRMRTAARNPSARRKSTAARPALRPSPQADLPGIAIVGRPNVGKSTLFNRLTRTRRSIVGDEPGITRDRIYGLVEWQGRSARLIDTGGIVPTDAALIPSEIFRQAQVALKEAQAIILVVDGRTDLAAPDLDLARLLLRSGKPVFVAVNKMETDALLSQAENFRSLGFPHLLPVSAEHGLGIAELMDAVFAVLPKVEPGSDVAADFASDPEEEDADAAEKSSPMQHEVKVAIIGRPNVGKSTMLNALTGSARAIVSPIAGTTRDAVDAVVTQNGMDFRLIDTAGIRRKGKTTLMAEKLSVVMARKHLEAADVALLMIDATEGVTALDATIGGYAHESGRSVIVVINKWDCVTTARTDGKPPADRAIYEEQARHALKFLGYAPMLFLSATEGKQTGRVFEAVRRVAAERRKRISTAEMNRFLEQVDFERTGLPSSHQMRILYMTQAAVAPPMFVLFTDRDVKLHFSYERFLENQIRAAFGFSGTPIRFKIRARKKKSKR
jgi:GTP-binding protein